jgi:adenylate/guanylate cyclase family protein
VVKGFRPLLSAGRASAVSGGASRRVAGHVINGAALPYLSRRTDERSRRHLLDRSHFSSDPNSVEEHDIFGDGVNIAARLEALAEPGGICVSRVVRDQIRDKLSYPFEDMGERSVKNIARPVAGVCLAPRSRRRRAVEI